MNTRNAIQTNDQPTVLSISFSSSRNRFIVGLSEGCRVFRTDNCLTTCHPRLESQDAVVDGGIGVAAIHDDRYFAIVRGGRTPQGSTQKCIFWDAMQGKQLKEYDLHEPIVGLRVASSYAAVILRERTILFRYQEVDSFTSENAESGGKLPNIVDSLQKTAPNPFGLCQLHNDVAVLPAQSVGQVQLLPLPTGSKRVLRAHKTALRALALSIDGFLIATASTKGTLIRIFDTRTLDQIAEFRRGVDDAIIYSLAISPGNRWVACTSDKGTLHIFDLRPKDIVQSNAQQTMLPHRRSISQARSTAYGVSPSTNSGARSSPPASTQYQGSVQEYYGLLPPPSTTSPTPQTAANSALNAFKQSAFAPRAFKDIRSVVSMPFYMGNEKPHWQGGPASVWTVGPDGTKRRVQNAVPALANDPSGHAPKGVIAFADAELDDAEGALLYVVGGGSDARWERFRLLRNDSTKEWTLINEGYRKYLTRQFVD